MNKWCDHIEWQMRCGDGNKGQWYMTTKEVLVMDSPLWIPDDWTSCPYDGWGAKRPEENKDLFTRIHYEIPLSMKDRDIVIEGIEKQVKKWARDLIDECVRFVVDTPDGPVTTIRIEELKNKVKENE